MKNSYNNQYYKPKQIILPLDLEKIISFSDPVYDFCKIIDCIDLKKFFVLKENKTGRPEYDKEILLKIILFAFMDKCYTSVRNLQKLCETDIRFMYLLEGKKAPSYVTFANFMNNELIDSIEEIHAEIMRVIAERDNVDLEHTYIDGTKIEANANKYTWVWKKSCTTNRDKVFVNLTELINQINDEDLSYQGIKFETREEYVIEYLEEIISKYKETMQICEEKFVYGKGKRKTPLQRKYEQLVEYRDRLKNYADHLKIIGDKRGSYSKTDNDATFMRIKKDYMGNDQLLPAYNFQAAVCDEYIAAFNVMQYASDMDCFIPLMEEFKSIYGHYPTYPVADAGYGSYNNYLFCEQHGMEKFMKFTMFEKETKDKNYQENKYRAVNFERDDEGNIICPNNKKFVFKYEQHVKGNNYGRTEEIYECEDCSNCPYKKDCSPKSKNNRTIKMNRELTSIHEEVISNLCSIHGALLCMNRSIQAEGTYGILKWDRSYKRLKRRGMDKVKLEFGLLVCGYNLAKYYNKMNRQSDENNNESLAA